MVDIVSRESVGFDDIRKDLMDALSNSQDGKTWTEYFQVGEASTLIDLMAGIGAFCQYNSIAVARESGITCGARLKSSIYGAADILGYPVNRKQSLRFKLKINSSVDVWLDRNYPIGTLGNAQVSLVNSTQVNVGMNVLECTLGSWEFMEKRVMEQKDYYECRWDFRDVDNIGPTTVDEIDNSLLNIYVDNVLIRKTRYLELLGQPDTIGGPKNNCFTKSLAYSFSVFFGTPSLAIVPPKNSMVKVEFIKVEETKDKAVPDNVSLSSDKFTVSDLTVITPFYDCDSLEKICFLAPRYHSARRMMVNKYDHEACTMSYPGMVSVKWVHGYCTKDGGKVYASNSQECTLAGGSWTKATDQCCTSTMAYLFADGHVMTAEEEEEVFKFTDPFRHEGDTIKLLPSEKVNLTRSYKVLMTKNSDADVLTKRIKALVNQYCDTLGIIFREEELNEKIRDLEGVVLLYPLISTGDFRTAEHQYLSLDRLQIQFESDPDVMMTH